MQGEYNTSSISKIKKTRKKHRNSKYGCTNCKQRQIKCDECLPICNNCRRRNEACSYLFMHTHDFQRLMRVKNAKEKEALTDDNDIDDYPNVEKMVKKQTLQHQDDSGTVNTAAGTNPLYDSGFDITEEKLKKTFANSQKKIKEPSNQNEMESSVIDAMFIGQSFNDIYKHEEPFLKNYDVISGTSTRKHESQEESNLGNDLEYGHDENLLFPSETGGDLSNQPYHQYKSLINRDIPPEITLGSLSKFFGNSPSNSYELPMHAVEFFDLAKYKDSLKIKDDYTLKRPTFYSKDKLQDISPIQPKPIKNSFPNINSALNALELGNARIANKEFKINRIPELDWLDPLLKKVEDYLTTIEKGNKEDLALKFENTDTDRSFDKIYKFHINFVLLFSNLIRKSMILFITDSVKNFLCKQKAVLPKLNDNRRVDICGICEQYSIELFSELTFLIQNQYICKYAEFSDEQRRILLDGFIRIASCTVYHYNSGYGQSISVEQSRKCVKYLGAFTTGIFSIAINENDKPGNQPIDVFKTYSKHFLVWAKRIIVPNYNFEILQEIHKKLSDLKLNVFTEFAGKKWSSCYINLNSFLEKNCQFLKVYREARSLLGFEKSYIIRMLNEWYQIYPLDLVNIVQYKLETEDDEILAIIYLTFIALRYYLEALIPGIRSLIKSSFIGTEKSNEYGIMHLVNICKTLKNKSLKLYAIYIIRLATLFAIRFDRANTIVSDVFIPEFSSSGDMAGGERCQNLIDNWKFGDVLREIQKTSLDFKGGLYIEDYNYITMDHNHKVNVKTDNKIRFRSKQDMIADFEKTNSGLFSKDYDPRKNLTNTSNSGEKITACNSRTDRRFRKISIAYNCDGEANSNTMRNCWMIEHHIKLGN